MKLKKIIDLIFKLLGVFTIVTGLAIVVKYFHGSLNTTQFIYSILVISFYFVLVRIRAWVEKKH